MTVAIEIATETDSSRTVTAIRGIWPSFSGTRTDVSATDDLDALVTAAVSGDVLILTDADAVYALSVNVPAGVSLVGASPCTVDSSTPIILWTTGTPTLGAGCTVRDLNLAGFTAFVLAPIFVLDGDCWFENCTFYYGKVFSTGPGAGETATFSRCYFSSTAAQYMADTSGARTGTIRLEGCLLVEGRTVTTDALIELAGQDLKMVNCTVVGASNLLDMTDGDTDFRNCVFTTPPTTVASTNGSATGSSNWGVGSAGVPFGQTIVTALNLHDQSYAPRNTSPTRAGGDATYSPTLDRNYFPYASTSPSAGCYQWQREGSCVYKPRFLDPLSGLSLTFGAATLSDLSGVTTVNSPMCVASIIRSYVADLIHPSRGHFWVTYDGYYRLALSAGGVFSLTTTGDAAKVLGTVSLTDTADTG